LESDSLVRNQPTARSGCYLLMPNSVSSFTTFPEITHASDHTNKVLLRWTDIASSPNL